MGSPNNRFKVGDGYACCWICFCQVDRSLLTEGVTVEETHHSKEDLDLLRDHYHRNPQTHQRLYRQLLRKQVAPSALGEPSAPMSSRHRGPEPTAARRSPPPRGGRTSSAKARKKSPTPPTNVKKKPAAALRNKREKTVKKKPAALA